MRIFDQPSRQEATFSSMPAEGGHNFFPPPFMPQDASGFPQGLDGGIPSNSWPAFKMPQASLCNGLHPICSSQEAHRYFAAFCSIGRQI